jgi:excisionase family DNA binding protein
MPAATVGHMSEPLLDVEQAKELLNVTTKWIYQRTYRNELPHLKVGGLLRFRASELNAYLRNCERGAR